MAADVLTECTPAQDYRESKLPHGYSRLPDCQKNTICVAENLYLLLKDFCEIRMVAEAFSIEPRYYMRSIEEVLMYKIVKVVVATEKSGIIHGSGAYLLIEKQGERPGQAQDAPAGDDYQKGKWVIIRKQMWVA